MERFFREAFAQNRPCNEIVHDLVGAEGRSDENGAVNYLLAQMVNNDEAVQATAKTTPRNRHTSRHRSGSARLVNQRCNSNGGTSNTSATGPFVRIPRPQAAAARSHQP